MNTPEEQAGVAESPSEPSTAVDSLLGQIRQQLDLFLPKMPVNAPDARRAITREFSYEPTPEAMQTIVKIAETIRDSAEPDLQTSLFLQILPVKILAERTLTSLLESERLHPSSIASAAGLLADLLSLARENEARLRSAMENAKPEEYELLERVSGHLGPPARVTVAALTLAPTLQALAQSAAEGAVGTAFRSLTAQEAARFARAVEHPEDSAGRDRNLLNALALRAMIHQHLDAWSELTRLGGGGPSMIAVRHGLFAQLHRDRDAYDYFSDRLRHELDAGLATGQTEAADELRKVQFDLVNTYRVLETVLAEGASDGLGEPAAKPKAGKSAQEEIRLAVLAQLKSRAESEDPHRGERDVGREQLRVKRLASVAGVLLIVAIAVNVLMWKGTSAPNPISPTDFNASPGLQEVTDLGPVLYSKVNSKWAWSTLSVTEKRERLAQLGLQGSARGFDMVILVDEGGRELAMWSVAGGTKLLEAGR